MGYRISLGTFAIALVVMLSTAAAQAAPPANDDFASATTIAGKLPTQVSGTNLDATKQVGEPDHGGESGGASVWYRWTAAATAPVQIHTCNGPALDTLLSVYTQNGVVPPFTNLQEQAGNDDFCAQGSLAQLDAVAGTTYKIAVDSFSGLGPPVTGPFALRISADIPTVAIDSGPGNDSDPTPTWTFRVFGAGGPVTLNCTIFKRSPGGIFIAYLEQPGCPSPFTPGTSLTEGDYLLDVVATSATGESSLTSGERPFTIQAALPTTPLTPATAPTGKKKCKKGKKLKRGKCVKKKRKRRK